MSDNKTTNKEHFSSVIRLILVTIIPIIVIIISFYVGGFAPFGNKNVLTASKTPEELFKYYEMYDHFKNNPSANYSNSIATIHLYYSQFLWVKSRKIPKKWDSGSRVGNLLPTRFFDDLIYIRLHLIQKNLWLK